MIKNTNTTTAAVLRSGNEPSFVVPTGASAFWHVTETYGINHATVGGRDALGFGVRTTHDVPPTDLSPSRMAVRTARVTTKQDRPPRGIPR
jgi:hypothetical protein